MSRRITLAAATAAMTVLATASLPAAAAPAAAAPAAATASGCSSGAHTLSRSGDHVYPETGNGGYTSLHTRVGLVYDAVDNTFLRGNGVQLTELATHCLTDFSLDLERHSPFADGPDLSVTSVRVDGRPARWTFVQPTYPGDPHGQDDPDPRAHQAGQNAVVGGPRHNPLPPACSPELPPDADADALDGSPCPANKLVITPSQPVAAGTKFRVAVSYVGRPGVHEDGDGSQEGWFVSDVPAGDGGFVTTEPVGTEDWMPLNDHPSAKPTYDFIDTVTAGRTVLANGILQGHVEHAASRLFPRGSTTWRWHMASPVASYLVEDSVGDYDLSEHTGADGVRYYEAQSASLGRNQKAANRAVEDEQPDITAFQSGFNGAYPFASAGVVVGRPDAGFEEEMEGMITFASGHIDADTLNHENMHQWWGDNVTESNYDMTFYKEGLATLGEFLYAARNGAAAKGGTSSALGAARFEHSLRRSFKTGYDNARVFGGAPSDPTPYRLFSGSSTYDRPGIAYVALRQILGAAVFTRTLQTIQRRYGGATITERQLEAQFRAALPVQTSACRAHLAEFFSQWFDTDYPTADGTQRPSITGPGLTGAGFYDAAGGCE